MSKLLKVLYDVAEIRCRYHRVHDEVLGFSARRILRSIHRTTSDDARAREGELDRLLLCLAEAREDLGRLSDEDLSVRRGGEIRDVLVSYVEALSTSTICLKAICEHTGPSDDDHPDHDREHLTSLKVAYDDAVQYQKRLGKRLNELISSL